MSAAAPRPAAALRRAAALTRSRWRRLGLSVLLGAGAIAAAAGLLATSGYLISRAAERPSILTLTTAIVGVRFFGIARALLRYAERLVSHDLAFRVLAGLRVSFFVALTPLVPAGLRGVRRGDLLSRFVADVDRLQDLYLRGLAPPLVAVVTIAGAGLAAALMLPAAGAALAAVLAAGAVLIPLATAAAARGAARRQAPARAELTAELVEVIAGAPELAVAGRTADRAARVDAADAALARAQARDAAAGGIAAGLATALSVLAVVAVLAVAIPAVRDGSLDGVLLAALALLALASFEGVAPLGAAAQGLEACARSAARVEAVTERPAPVAEPAAPQALPAAGELVAAGVRARYGPGTPWVLDGVDLCLAPGRSLALVGSSGAGKTTLADLLVRFRDPDAGTVSFGGVDLRSAADADVRRAIRLAGQDAHLFATTIRNNVGLGRPGAGDDAIAAAIGRAGLGAWLDALPDGLGTDVGERGAKVSGGQRQRLAVARVLLSEAPVLVLDEPAAHLDPPAARALLAHLARVAPDRAVLVITHLLDGLEGYDEVARLEGGRIAERGTHAELLAAGGRYAALVRSGVGALA
jgi:ATP-binding cassette, subfamily C, bacterial CydC